MPMDAPDPIDAHVGRVLRELRLDRGLSLDAMGDALGITYQQVQKYERGINRISASRLYRAAKVLGVSPSAFFPGGGGSLMGPSADHDDLDTARAMHRIKDERITMYLERLIETLARDAG